GGEEITPNHHHDRSAEIKPNADPEHASEEENTARHVLGFCAEPYRQKFVDALHAVVVVRFDEGERDDDPRENRADRQLAVKVASCFKTFGGRAEKSG